MKKLFALLSFLFLMLWTLSAANAIHEVNHSYFSTIGRNDPVTFDSGLEAYAILSKEFIGKGGKCKATLNEKSVEEKRLVGPSEDGVCKYNVSGNEFELFSITKEHTGKNIPFSFTYYPSDCESDKCADSIKSDFLLGVVSSEEPTEPLQCENNVSVLDIEVESNPIADCEKFVTKPVLSHGFPCGFCEARINGEKPDGASYIDSPGGPLGGGCSGVEILPNEFDRFKIKGPGSANIKWLYFPQGCGSEACASVLDKNVDVVPCTSSTNGLSVIIEDLDSIHEELLEQAEELSNRALRIVANKVNRTIDLLDTALEAVEDEDPDSCDEDLSRTVRAFDAAITQLENRQCRVRSSKRCISRDIVETYLPELEDIFDSLEEEISIDDDDDGLPDVCSF